MQDPIMAAGVVFFFILFSFLLFLFTVFIISLFIKKKPQSNFSPFISILIPMYNEQEHIAACIDAIYQTTYPKHKREIIVIDDGSTDNSRKIVKKYKNVILLSGNHEGKVTALNIGRKKAKGEFIVGLDADTVIDKKFLEKILAPFHDKKVGATSGAVLVTNKHGLIGMFQNIEYHYNNLIRKIFSEVFDTGIWFFGSLSAYRRSALDDIGGFKQDTMAEDMDIAMDFKAHGYKTINVVDATGHTAVPTKIKELFMQRSRWWIGGLQSLIKHKRTFKLTASPSILFLFINHFWWAFYSFVSFPLFIYQIFFWLPSGGAGEIALYLFRWFSLTGPVYVLYKIPEWGLNWYNIFGVLSGVFSTIMLIAAIYIYKDKLSWRNILAVFFYFPYTILLNLIMAGSVIRGLTLKKKYFIK